jgi:hypothetical protein
MDNSSGHQKRTKWDGNWDTTSNFEWLCAEYIQDQDYENHKITAYEIAIGNVKTKNEIAKQK